MSFETKRINELAKEMGISSKEILDKLAQISITGKTHSSTLTPEQVKKLKDFMQTGEVKEVKKPKAFVVKKSKNPEPSEKTETKTETTKKEQEKQTPRVEIVKPKSVVNRVEIVRQAEKQPEISSKPRREQGGRPERTVRTQEDETNAPKKQTEKPTGERKPIQRKIIIYII